MKLKTLLLIAISIISFDCFAQDFFDIDEWCNFYILPNRGYKYVAKKYNSTDEDRFRSVKIFENGKFTGYRTSHGSGDYFPFQYTYMIISGRYASCKQVMFCSNKGNGSGYYAFARDGGKICIVDLKTDDIISTFDINPYHSYNINKGEFSIYVEDPSSVNNEQEPSFWIYIGGSLYTYNGFPAATTSAKSIVMDNEESGRKYNLAGVEIENPKNEVYIQNGKKYIAK